MQTPGIFTDIPELSTSTFRSSDEHTKVSMAHIITHKNKPTLTLDGSLARPVLPIRPTCVNSVCSFLKKLEISVTSHQPRAGSRGKRYCCRLVSSFSPSFSSFSPSLNIVFKLFCFEAHDERSQFELSRWSSFGKKKLSLNLATSNNASLTSRGQCKSDQSWTLVLDIHNVPSQWIIHRSIKFGAFALVLVFWPFKWSEYRSGCKGIQGPCGSFRNFTRN